ALLVENAPESHEISAVYGTTGHMLGSNPPFSTIPSVSFRSYRRIDGKSRVCARFPINARTRRAAPGGADREKTAKPIRARFCWVHGCSLALRIIDRIAGSCLSRGA